ncbi:MAG: 50S ribosomal protein L28 [Bacilli bacterium]|nr:50S ribosomal protein L28 [Bacilli bacterium]
MSKVCPITNKGPLSGNNRSHSMRATRTRWNVNLQKYTVVINGKKCTIRMSARAHRALMKSEKKAD